MQPLNFILGSRFSSRFSFRFNSKLGLRFKLISSTKCNFYSSFCTTFPELELPFLCGLPENEIESLIQCGTECRTESQIQSPITFECETETETGTESQIQSHITFECET